MWWKFRYLVSLVVTISLKARSETLFVVSGNYYPDQQESSVEAWDISPVIVRKLKQNVRGEVQLAAAMQLPVENETLWDSGMGSLELRVRENEVEPLACAYMSVSGADGKYHDDPNTINIALSCPVRSDLSKALLSDIIVGKVFAKVSLVLHPICIENSSCPTQVTSIVDSNIFKIVPSKENYISSPSRAVVTIQTFKNRLTGPMLYFFTRHYHSLGYAVIIFDRYSNHESYLRDFITTDLSSKVYYYGHTIFEQMMPQMYNASFRSKLEGSFMYYYHFQQPKKEERKYVQGHETQNQNSDKRKTFNYARQKHPEFDFMLYLDRDEILYCNKYDDVPSNMTIKEQATIQNDLIRYFMTSGYDSISFQRHAYAARLPLGLSNSQNESVRQSIQENFLPNCLEKGYSMRSMMRMWECWGKHFEKHRQFKSGDMKLTSKCPFVGLHETCLRCKCNHFTLSRKAMKNKRVFCHIMHLNNVYVKAWLNPKKWKDDINQVNEEQIRMWRGLNADVGHAKSSSHG